MKIRRAVLRLGQRVLAAGMLASAASAQELPNLPPITPQELKMTDNPAAPGGIAIILYYAVESDNTKWSETYSVRIKVLKEEGKKYADIEIPYYDKDTKLEELHARTISPDGKVTESAGQIFDREVVKAKKFQVNEKVLTLPNVQVGSILEYSYRLHFKGSLPDAFKHPTSYYLQYGFTWPSARWTLQHDLFVRHAEFRLIPVKDTHVREYYLNVPKGHSFEKLNDGTLRYYMDDIPAYEEEDLAPPEEASKMRLALYYAIGFLAPEDYWRGVGERRAETINAFIGNSKAVHQEAAKIVAPNASEEAKARAIYARVQKIRAVSYEDSKTDKEMKQENLRENKHAEDVLTHGYAYANEINLLYVALARAAGLQAGAVMVTARDRAVFLKDYPRDEQLNAMVVQVHLAGNDVFLDPATRFCPYGLLPWNETGAGGVLFDSGGGRLLSTPNPASSDAVTRTVGDLRLSADGRLSGKVTVTFSGQEALAMRLNAIHKDEAKRREELEQQLQVELTQGASVKLMEVQGWEDVEPPLKATFEIDVPNFAAQTGKRLLLPASVLQVNRTTVFAATHRTQPIYFKYPAERYEDMKIQLPPEVQAEALPEASKMDPGAVLYELAVKKEGNAVIIARKQKIVIYAFKKEAYLPLRDFYSRMQASDTQQITLSREEAAKAAAPEKLAAKPEVVQRKPGETHP
jgi:transglutaminase-like putative cysteine protease